MEVTVKISDKLGDEARELGVPLEAYVQDILAKHARSAANEAQRALIGSAIQRIFELRKGNRLEGLTPKQMISEGRKY